MANGMTVFDYGVCGKDLLIPAQPFTRKVVLKHVPSGFVEDLPDGRSVPRSKNWGIIDEPEALRLAILKAIEVNNLRLLDLRKIVALYEARIKEDEDRLAVVRKYQNIAAGK